MTTRSEPRLPKNGTVRIFGMDSKGHPVNVEATVLDVSKHGARLGGVHCWEVPGEIIGIRYEGEKARYRIVWVGKAGGPVGGQIGVSLVETGKYIWDVFPPETPIMQEESVVPLGGTLGRSPEPHVGLNEPKTNARRETQRFNVTGGANVREAGKDIPHWTTINDLSMGGCYLETTDPLPAESRVDVTIQVKEIRIDVRGIVTVKHPLVGMGIRFTDITPLNRERLQHLITLLEKAHSRAMKRGM